MRSCRTLENKRWILDALRDHAAQETSAVTDLLQLFALDKAGPDRLGITENIRFPDPSLRNNANVSKLLSFVDQLNPRTVYRASRVSEQLRACGLPAQASGDSGPVMIDDYPIESSEPEWGKGASAHSPSSPFPIDFSFNETPGLA